MSQYLQFRSWTRTSSKGERTLAATAAGTVLALTAWALVPTTSTTGEDVLDGTSQSSLDGSGAAVDPQTGAVVDPQTGAVVDPGTGAVVDPATGGAGPAAGGGAAAGGTSGGTAPGAAGGSTGGSAAAGSGTTGGAAAPGGTGGAAPAGKPASCAPSGEVGVSAQQVRVAAVLINLGGAIGNGAVGVSSPEQQRKMSNAVVKDINARGGVGCRQVAVTFFEANPIDARTSQEACLKIAQGKFYAAIDLGGFAYPPGGNECVAQKKIPIFGGLGPSAKQQQQFGPYYLSMAADPTVAARTSMLGMKQQGYFDPAKGFKKLGMYIDKCFPEVNAAVYAALSQVGIQKSAISIYEFDCPGTGFAPPSEANAAVIQHQRAGVTHVIPVTGGGSFKPYSEAAQRQNYKPKYTITDLNGMIVTTTGGVGPDRDNFDGTVAVTTTRFGMENSGFSSPATDACAALFKRHGVDPKWITNGFLGGNQCNSWQTFAAAVNKAPALTRPNLAVGLAALRRVATSFPQQDAVFGPRDVTGSDFWWPIQYSKACNCWKVLDRTPKPNFR